MNSVNTKHRGELKSEPLQVLSAAHHWQKLLQLPGAAALELRVEQSMLQGQLHAQSFALVRSRGTPAPLLDPSSALVLLSVLCPTLSLPPVLQELL